MRKTIKRKHQDIQADLSPQVTAMKGSNINPELRNWYTFEKSDEQVFVKYNAALNLKQYFG